MKKMALPLSGPNEGVLVAIEGERFNFYIKGSGPALTKVSEEDLALYEVSGKEKLSIEISGICQEQGKALRLYAAPLFFEQRNYEVIIEAVGEARVTLDHDSTLIRKKITPLGKLGKMQSGVINFGSEIGFSEFRILVEGKLYMRLVLEVYPTKLSYKADYLKLQEEVTKEIYNLAFDFMKQTYQSAGLVQTSRPSLTEFFSIYRQQFKELKTAIHLISHRPYHQLVQEQELLRYQEGKPITKKGIQYLNKHPHQLIQTDQRISAKKLLVIKKQNTTDVYENQVVKFMLEQILRRLQSVRQQYKGLAREQDVQVSTFIEAHIGYIEQQLGESFFRNISRLNRPLQFSLVMQMSAVYRKFYKVYLMLQRGLSITEDIFQIAHKNVAELYEYWCFIKLGSLLKKHHQLKGTNVIQVDSRGLYVSLQKGKTSTMSFIHSKTGESFTLSYNQKLSSKPTVAQRPDNILMLEKEMRHVTYHYVLDAKYKLDYDKLSDQILEVPKEEDINTIHRYRDAIVSAKGKTHYEQLVFGGVILFPGNEEELYKQHRFYRSIETVNIGGLPFLPSKTQLVEAFLEDLVEGSGHQQYQHLPFLSGLKDYFEDLDIARKNVLIGPVKSAAQLKATLEKRLYHVPQKHLKAMNKQIETIVLYEPKGKEDLLPGGGIRYEGKVKSAVALPRKALVDVFPMEQANGEEIYIVYEISIWKERKEVLLPSRRAPVRGPRYSNTTLLAYAKTLPELYIKDELEFNLILQLRRSLEDLTTGLGEEEQFEMSVGNIRVVVNEALQSVAIGPNEMKVFEREVLEKRPREIYEWIKQRYLV